MTAADRLDDFFVALSLYSLAAIAVLALCVLVFRKLKSPAKKEGQ